MKTVTKQLSAFGALLFLVISPVASISGQKRISESQASRTASFKRGALETKISTAKANYAAGETVAISGSGFGKFEQVGFSVERVNAYAPANDLLSTWTVTADENGNISGEWYKAFDAEFLVRAKGLESGVQTETVIAASVTPVLVSGNPSCATLNASSDPAFAHITTDFGLKLDANPATGNYPFTTGGIRSLTGGAPAEPGNSIDYTKIDNNTFSFTSTRSISAVIIKAGSNANVYPYNPATFGDTNLVTAGNNAISHVEFCYGPASASITIIKDAQPNTPQAFSFTASGQVNQNFNLVDNGVVGPDRIVFSNLTGFGAANAVTVTEGASAPYSLTSITCTSNGSGAENNTINVPVRFATVQLEPGEAVVCRFVNSITTAANVSASGRVLTAFGNPISRARVTLQNTATGESRTVYSSSFGHYSFENLPSGEFYVITVSHGRYTFSQSSQIFVLDDAVQNMDFIADYQ
ncbi:MAG TPA: carboxypeptidase-like regulatory domain-containing protein [Pyrinomonadaceae bacterium]|jgi:hypothetical protein